METKVKRASRVRSVPYWEASRLGVAPCRLSVYLSRVLEERGAELTQLTHDSHLYARQVAALVVGQVFELSSRISQYFDKPTFSAKNADVIEEQNPGKYVCRLFVKHSTLPLSFKVQFGPQNGLSPGSATCRLNAELNAEEQTITKREWRACLSDDLYLSPDVIFPWFSQEIFRVLDIMRERNYDEQFGDVIFWKLFPGVQLFLPTAGRHDRRGRQLPLGQETDSQLELLFMPAVRGSGWPGGAKIQHALPRQKPFISRGTASLRRLARLVEDGKGGALWALEPTPRRAEFGGPSSGCWLARKRGILAKAEPTDRRRPVWQVSLRPVVRILKNDLVSGLRDGRFDRDVDVEALYGLVAFFKAQHDWLIFTNDVIDSAVLCTVKRHLVSCRTTGAMLLKVMAFLRQVAQTKSCPSFLMPNLNILHVTDVDEAEQVAINVDIFLSAMEEDETYVLKYLGYKSRSELEEERQKDSGLE